MIVKIVTLYYFDQTPSPAQHTHPGNFYLRTSLVTPVGSKHPRKICQLLINNLGPTQQCNQCTNSPAYLNLSLGG